MIAIATGREAHPQRAVAGALRPCPFCGGSAAVEPDPWSGESVRIGCGDAACRVRPRTEYLLACYADELRAAWNGRHEETPHPPANDGPPPPTPPRKGEGSTACPN